MKIATIMRRMSSRRSRVRAAPPRAARAPRGSRRASQASNAGASSSSSARRARAASPSATKSPVVAPSSSSASSVSPRAGSGAGQLAARHRVARVEPRARGAATPRRRAAASSSASEGTSASKKRSTSAGGSAPVNSAATLPSRNALTAGMPWMPERGRQPLVGVHVDLRELDLARRAPAAARSSTGVSCLHGPHQSAQKSTTTGTSFERSSTRDSKLASSTSWIGASVATDARLLDHDGLERRAGLAARRVAERPIFSTTSSPPTTLPSTRVVGRQPGVGAGDDVELAAGGARRLGLGLGHGHRALR